MKFIKFVRIYVIFLLFTGLHMKFFKFIRVYMRLNLKNICDK